MNNGSRTEFDTSDYQSDIRSAYSAQYNQSDHQASNDIDYL